MPRTITLPDWWTDALAPFDPVITTRAIRRTGLWRVALRFAAGRPVAEAQGLAGYLCREGTWRYERMEWYPLEDGTLVVDSLTLIGPTDA